MTLAIKLITSRGVPSHYEVYELETRSLVHKYERMGDEPDLSAALDRARAYVDSQMKENEHGKTST